MKKYLLFLLLLFALAACRQADDKQSLQGQWLFALDPDDRGTKEQWYTRTLDDTLRLPGSLQEQGYGNNVSTETQWTGQVVDRSWYNAPEYEKYRQPGNTKVPFWLNPDKHYVGVAWYQKEIEIPEAWSHQPIQLELERTHWETTLFIDGTEAGKSESLSTPFRYTFNELTPGRHTLTLRVDNRVNIAVGSNAHSVSDHTQSNWNGAIGNLSLAVKPAVYIDDIQIYPDAKSKSVRVAFALEGQSATEDATVLFQVENADGTPVGTRSEATFSPGSDYKNETTIKLKDDVLLWSEHEPNLYTLRTTVEVAGRKEQRTQRFGFREFKANGTRFEVNGQPVFLRGTLECCIFPLTGYPAMDKGYWEKIYSQCKTYGLNHVRFHSWCPPEAAFSVADSMGVYLQVECAGWATVGDGEYSDQWFYNEGDRILKEYGNHPSFCLMAYGNEPGGQHQVKYLSDLVAYWKEKDNRHVYTSSGGWPYLENADYWNAPDPRIQGWGQGLQSIINAQPPRTDYDFAGIIRPNMPTVSHEIGQWCVYPNFKEIDKYTGVLKAKNMEIFRETLKENQMADLAEPFLYASGRLQTLCYKADIEAALRTPGFAGFQLLDLHDFPGQGTALVGVLDAFWDEKGYVDGKEYSTFCNSIVPLVRFPKMIWKNTDTLKVPIEVANFGKEPLKNVKIGWSLRDQTCGEAIAQGSCRKDLPFGNCLPGGEVTYHLDYFTAPTQLTVTAEVFVDLGERDTIYTNQWNIWVYPAEQPKVEKLPYITSRLDQQAMARLDKGENVLLLLPKGSILPEKGGKIAVGFSSIFWNTAWTNKQPPHELGIYCDPKHPALQAFPTDGYSDYQWWDVVTNAQAMVLDDFPADFRPVVHLIDDWFTNRKLGILFEAKVSQGKLVVCSADLQNDLNKRQAAAQLKQSILQYMASDGFNPTQQIDPQLIRTLYTK